MATMTTSTPDVATDLSTFSRAPWRPSRAGGAARLVVFGALVALFLAIPLVITDTLINVYSRAIVYGIVALSMNILIGYAGQVSLGHQAFVGVGAFSSAFFLDKAGLPWGLAVVASVILGGLIALGLGAVSLRVKGLYFALVTIAYGLFVERTVFGITSLTGGGAGALANRPSFAQTDLRYAYLCFALLVLAWVFDWRLTASRAGRAIQALRDDERVAASWGINVRGYKLLAFALSGAVAALAGAAFASIEQVVSPITFGFSLGLTFVLMTVVGGVGSRPGVVVGGFVFAALPTLLDLSHVVWGDGETSCTSAPPDIIQFLLLLVVALGVLERIVHAVRHGSGGSRIAAVVVGLPVVGAFGWWALGGFLGHYCLWSTIQAEMEPAIGAGLLLITLIQYPGGIAQQFGPVFRWLSFKPFTTDESTSVGGGAAGGDMGARP